MIEAVLALGLTGIFSVMTQFAFLGFPRFPTSVETDTFDVVNQYSRNLEFDPRQPPLAYFPYLLMQNVMNLNGTWQRILPATCAAVVPPLVVMSMLRNGMSVPSAFAAGVFLALGNSFGKGGRLCGNGSLFDLFAVLTIFCFLAIERSGKRKLLLILEAIFLSLSICTDSCGLVLLLHILIVAAFKYHKNLKDLYDRVEYLIILVCPVVFFAVLVHISLVSGPSDIYPFRMRFFHVILSILSPEPHENIAPLILQMNLVVVLFSTVGVVCAIIRKEFEMVPAFFIALLSMLYSSSSFVTKAHIMFVFGVISAFEALEKVDTHRLHPYAFLSLLAVFACFFVQFPSRL